MSTAENLSQEEIIELEQAFVANAAQASDRTEREVRSYDFLHPDKLSKSHQRVLQYILSGLDKSWSSTLSSSLRKEVIVELRSIEQASFSSYSESCQSPGMTVAVKIEPLSVTALFDYPAAFALGMVDRLSGGKGKWPGDPRSLTAMEEKILKKLVGRMTEDFARVWRPVVSIECEVSAFHRSHEDVGLGEETMVLVAGFSVGIGYNEHRVNLAIPMSGFDSIRDNLTPENWARSEIAAASSTPTVVPGAPISNLLGPISMQAEVELGRATVTMQDLLGIAVGDVIRLDRGVEDHLEVRVGRQHKFWGVPGMSGAKMAIRITETVRDEDARADLVQSLVSE